MNKLKTATLLFCLTLVSVSALGQIKVVDHATHKADDTTTAAVPTTANGNVDSITPMMEKMQDGMKQMQDVMAQIQGSRDPVERRALLDKHQQAMQAQMQVMHRMSGEMMLAMMNKGGSQADDHKGSMMSSGKNGQSCADMMKGHQMMEGRMNMMQMMMEQMMQHETAERAATPSK